MQKQLKQICNKSQMLQVSRNKKAEKHCLKRTWQTTDNRWAGNCQCEICWENWEEKATVTKRMSRSDSLTCHSVVCMHWKHSCM